MPAPGAYLADATEGIVRPEDLPKPKIITRSRNYKRRKCPRCDGKTWRQRTLLRKLHALGRAGHPCVIHLTISQHFCPACKKYSLADVSDLAAPGGRYTHEVVRRAVAAVIEDSLPYGLAAWRMWRDHRVYTPPGTIQNWVEAAGKKSPTRHSKRIPRRGSRQLFRLHRGR